MVALLKLNGPGWALAVLSCLAMLTLFYWEETRTLPLPISRVHGEVAKIGGLEDCAQCHGSADVDMPSACMECHPEIREDIATPRGFHGLVVEQTGERCAQCHAEHAGPEFALVSAHSFSLAGFATREEFEHPWPEYDLDGAHLDIACEECHALADAQLLADGEQRFRGLSRDCASCHDDSPHQGQMERSCVSCHGQSQSFLEVPEFEHDERFPLVGIHDIQVCADCHERETATSIEHHASLPQKPAVRACDECHEAPHRAEFLEPLEKEPASAFTEQHQSACANCHRLEDDSWQSANANFEGWRHAASGFPLDGPHLEQACGECHDPQLDWDERYPGRARQDCAKCHENPHGEQFASNSNYPACFDCHGTGRFVPALFDEEQHRNTEFALIESHLGVGCLTCHEASAEEHIDRAWNALDQACHTCHEDGHDGYFLNLAGTLPTPAPQEDCDHCHNSTEFGHPSTDETFDHTQWTTFPLNDEHAEIACDTCHARQPRTELGRSFGKVEDVFGSLPTKEQPCLVCHQDPHDERILQSAPDPWQDKHGCARCHDEQSFRNASEAGFDHELWTKRELQGAHLALECQACHGRTPNSDALGRSFGRPAQIFGEDLARCDTCHLDIHDGVFERDPELQQIEGRQGCVRCHGEERFIGSLLMEFDHDTWTQTDLESGHSQQDCQACHPRVLAPSVDSRLRSPARGRECLDCHQDPHLGQFRESTRSTCRDCHGDQTDWTALTFDHDLDSVYALDQIHLDVDCTKCHPAVTFSNGVQAVRYKPLPMECADCHKAPGEDP